VFYSDPFGHPVGQGVYAWASLDSYINIIKEVFENVIIIIFYFKIIFFYF
jgi:hypothetical protein